MKASHQSRNGKGWQIYLHFWMKNWIISDHFYDKWNMTMEWKFPFILHFSTLTSSLCVRDWRWDQTRALTTGSTPTVGSSRMRILGLWSRANVLYILYILYNSPVWKIQKLVKNPCLSDKNMRIWCEKFQKKFGLNWRFPWGAIAKTCSLAFCSAIRP